MITCVHWRLQDYCRDCKELIATAVDPATLIDRETVEMEHAREILINSMRVPARLLGRIP